MRSLLLVVMLFSFAPSAYADEAPLYATVLVRFEGQPKDPKRRMLVDIQTYRGGAFTIELLDAKKGRLAIKKLAKTHEGVNETPFTIPKSLSTVHVWQGKRHARIPCRIGDNGWECEPYAEEDPDVPSKNPRP